MREIKLRIWDSDQGRVLPVITMYHDEKGVQWLGFQRFETGPEPASMEYCEASADDPAVAVMQFTGLHDKNGREIYEGDIVEWEWDGNLHDDIVEFSEGAFRIPLLQDYHLDFGDVEVVGNEWENPELLL